MWSLQRRSYRLVRACALSREIVTQQKRHFTAVVLPGPLCRVSPSLPTAARPGPGARPRAQRLDVELARARSTSALGQVELADDPRKGNAGVREALSAVGLGGLLVLLAPRTVHCESAPAAEESDVWEPTYIRESGPMSVGCLLEYIGLGLHFFEHRAKKLESQELLARSVKELETMSVVSALFVSLAFAVLSNTRGATLATSGIGGGTRLAVWGFLGINSGIFSVILSTVLQFQLNGCIGADVNEAVQDWNMIINANVVAFCASPFFTCLAIGQYFGAHYGPVAGAWATGLVLSSLSILACLLVWCGMRTFVNIKKHADVASRECK